MKPPPPAPVGRNVRVRRGRIAAIMAAVEAGRYRIPAELVTAAILDQARREADPG